ncbi:MAG: serine O-acetyltransferase [Phycisphaerales bacterium]
MTPPTSPSQKSIDTLIASILSDERTRHLSASHLPDQREIQRLTDEMRAIVFPGFFGERNLDRRNLAEHVEQMASSLASDLRRQVHRAIQYWDSCRGADDEDGPDIDAEAGRITDAFIARLPEVRRRLGLDIQAAFDGDPAACHLDEIIFCYPGVQAIMIHRLAHELHRLEVPLLPRIMSEYAHSQTGIDIHPGAQIGDSFFIDHGTGVVIGETTEIGRQCKVYQGVTLGAKSIPRDKTGRAVRGAKRHPTLGDRVTVYASATVLGGDTVIGDDCVIAGGVFLTKSVPPGHIVHAKSVELRVRTNPEADGYEMDASGI